MLPRRNSEKFQELTGVERERIIDIREGEFSNRAKGARVKRNSSTVMRVWKQWIDELEQLEKLAVDEGRAWQAEWHQAVFSNESCFHLRNHDGRIRVQRYASERFHPECVIERYSGLTPGVMFYKLKSFPSFKASLELSFSRIKHAHSSKPVRDFYSSQYTQLLPWPAYSLDMSPIEHVWDLVGLRLARDPRPSSSKDEHLLRIQATWNSLPQAFKICLTPCHVT
ncbi:transposable element Tcb2 transposase [Trichonephila clavipes]|uniref:Transposable element Tcb2 transposase n=1 Tax=Trichonephila clavipes TaxID=2585209 RepID=A0A8X6RM13_TRICX|nr:transposable element Tcb2 transposase [Trichonephila clavipes]